MGAGAARPHPRGSGGMETNKAVSTPVDTALLLWMDIIIDPAPGLLIGERVVTLTAGETFPAGTATAWTSVQTSVVNSAP
jgi:hypothetical protein